MSAQRDFWLSCGHHLLDRDAAGNLLVTDEFLKVYLARPELVPPPEACAAERKLHDALLSDPRRPVAPSQIAAIADADARENWEMMIAWRDHLVKHRTLEAAYLDIVRNNIKFPHVLIGQLTQAILRNALDDCDDVFVLRAAEMFFRPQKLMMQEGSVIAIDEETEAMLGFVSLSRRWLRCWDCQRVTEVDMLNDATAGSYWERSDRFDMALDLTAGQRGLVALGDVIRRWLAHLLAIDVVGRTVGGSSVTRVVMVCGLEFRGDAHRRYDLERRRSRRRDAGPAGRSVSADVPQSGRHDRKGAEASRYICLAAMTPDDVLRLKPQNLVTGLPIRHQGGGQLRSTALAHIPVGVVVERRKAKSMWARFSVATGFGVCRKSVGRAVDAARYGSRKRPCSTRVRP